MTRSKLEQQWMEEAMELARQAAVEDEVPVGAVVIHEGRIVGKGHNRREGAHNPVAHAEVLALQDAAAELQSWRLTGCTLFVTLEPCPMCLAASQQARVDRVIYGAMDPKGGALSLGYKLNEDERTNHRFAVEYQPTPESESLLKDFFRRRRGKTR